MAQLINHFPIWLRAAVQQSQAVSVKLTERMTLSIYPKERRYHSNFDIADIEQADIWNAQGHIVLPISEANKVLPQGHEDLAQLEWAVLWDEARRQAESRDFTLRYGLARLLAWPDLAQLPGDIVAPVARICALLERKATAGILIPMIIDLPEPHTYALLYLLHLQGHIDFLMPAGLSANDAKDREAVPAPSDEVLGRAAPSTSLIGKLWARLTAVK